jgi:nucleotide-binding universal stress UspA family protein
MPWFPKNRVVVPIDFSDKSLTAIDTALQLVGDATDVTVIHVLQKVSTVEPGSIWSSVTDDARIQHASKALLERLEEYTPIAISVEVCVGDPGQEIVDFAEQEKADLIVLTSHGRTGIKRLLIGSVAERVIRLAHCPVLILRT